MKSAILLAGFGTTDVEAYHCGVEMLWKEACSHYANQMVRLTFTSKYVVKKLRTQGIEAELFEDVLQELSADDCKCVVIQPFLLMEGEEYQKILDASEIYHDKFQRLLVGQPYIVKEDDGCLEKTFQWLLSDIRREADEKLLLLCHDAVHRQNGIMELLQIYVLKSSLPVYVSSLESIREESFHKLCKKLHENGTRKLCIVPFLFSAGYHVKKDIAGKQEGSWLQELLREGFEVRAFMHGMGESAAFRMLLLDRMQRWISSKV